MVWSPDPERGDDLLVVKERYFEQRGPAIFEGDTTYVDGPRLARSRTCEWNHGLGEILTAVVEAGLRIGFVHEHRDLPWRTLPMMEPVGPDTHGVDGLYQSEPVGAAA